METLLALGILSAYGYSVQQALTGGEHVYFDTVCALVTLVLPGKWFERSAKEKTSRGITLMYRMMPRKARILLSGRERFVSLEALNPGDLFVVKVGSRKVFIGNRQLAVAQADKGHTLLEGACRWEEEGRPVAFHGWDHAVQGILVLGDQLKPGVGVLVEQLKAQGGRSSWFREIPHRLLAGVLSPILAAGAMVVSSLSVIGNSLRLRR